MIEIIDNFLPEENYLKIKNFRTFEMIHRHFINCPICPSDRL